LGPLGALGSFGIKEIGGSNGSQSPTPRPIKEFWGILTKRNLGKPQVKTPQEAPPRKGGKPPKTP